MPIFEPMLRALNDAGVRYVIVGGVAVVLHGHVRLTTDLDLIVDLEPEQARKAIDVLVGLGLRPRAPVDPRQFAEPQLRAMWIQEKGMRVFTMFDPAGRREVDLFIETPIPFEQLWSRSVEMKLTDTTVRVASIADLIALKRASGRPVDLQDIETLEEILRQKEQDERKRHG
ncbi:MAG TPA: nucleotidyl transferase AbiEii/AbiGii toxin family protein [Candidatus Polarisedimenticolaceae bacterium]|nr:nucleotidyl transferase AbiEii/AbiGii toxin family protein [Candidatus Polarisedimenticolaceae bacterium]HEX5045184.1 nucleotidyl transferase AbiEii/AbiGii toxin family protein [Candidatus Polarisedimenticolaceae bacterium]